MDLNLPSRMAKPRDIGLNMIIDTGYPIQYFQDVIESFAEHIDFVKFGWGTALVTRKIQKKITILNNNGIKFCMGGTLFESCFYQRRLDHYKRFLDKYDCQYVEISNGTVYMPNHQKADYIKDFSQHYHVFSEVGFKDANQSENMSSNEWINFIKEDLSAGASKVITEAREEGNSGICHRNGDPRVNLIDAILNSSIDINNIVFEAPSKQLQLFFIENINSNCNLANIDFTDIIALETLRLGLRSDSFFINNPRNKHNSEIPCVT